MRDGHQIQELSCPRCAIRRTVHLADGSSFCFNCRLQWSTQQAAHAHAVRGTIPPPSPPESFGPPSPSRPGRRSTAQPCALGSTAIGRRVRQCDSGPLEYQATISAASGRPSSADCRLYARASQPRVSERGEASQPASGILALVRTARARLATHTCSERAQLSVTPAASLHWERSLGTAVNERHFHIRNAHSETGTWRGAMSGAPGSRGYRSQSHLSERRRLAHFRLEPRQNLAPIDFDEACLIVPHLVDIYVVHSGLDELLDGGSMASGSGPRTSVYGRAWSSV